MPSTGKLLAAVILVAMATVMAVLFSLLALFLWRQGVTSFVIFQNLGMICRFVLPKRGRAMILNSRFKREHSCDHSGLTEGSSNC